MKYTYPACKTVDMVEDWFGVMLPDPYAWLKNANDPEVLDFVARENAYTDAFFPKAELEAKIAALKAQALPELPGSIVPWKGGYLATMQRAGDYSVCVLDKNLRETGTLPEIPALAGDILFQAAPCPKDDNVFAIMLMKPGAPRLTIAVCDMTERTVLKEIDMVFGCTWSKADGCLYYGLTEANSEQQTSKTTYYRYDPAARTESVVCEDGRFAIFGQDYASHDGTYLVAQICRDYAYGNWIAIDCRTGVVAHLTKEPVEWIYIDSIDDQHYFITMSEAAHGAVIRVGSDGKCETVLPEREDRILESGFWAGGKLFAIARKDVSSRLLEIANGEEIPLPSEHCTIAQTGKSTDGVLLKYESFVDAPQILAFDGVAFSPVLRSSEKTHPDVVVEQRFAPSTGDGERIPYYIVYKKGTKCDGKNRVLMYGYGGYNISMPPSYMETVSQTQIPAWVEAGGIYVNCNLRGGNEYGPKWHEAGMGMQKRHCYEDFIGIAEQIIRDGWTEKGRIVISGCSNGGLLMSALVTMRPDLWGCVIDSVPHTDMIHFAEDDRGPMYITEYGNPRASREIFEYLRSYSPYHNVKKTSYPPTYIQTGELDNNVPPYHGKKLAARMQAENQSDNPILLRVLPEGSHDRGRGETFWRTIAEMHLFMEYALKEGKPC